MSISYKEIWFLFPPCSVHLIHRSKIDHNHAKEECYYGQKRSYFIYCCNECALISPITFVSCGWISLHCMSGNQLPNGRKTRESATQDLRYCLELLVLRKLWVLQKPQQPLPAPVAVAVLAEPPYLFLSTVPFLPHFIRLGHN